MTDPTNLTLGALVTASPAAARVFEQRGLDYCCGGKRTLAQACADDGVDVSEVVDAIFGAAEEQEPSWASLSPTNLVDHLEATHHRYLKDELPRLSALAAKVEHVHGERHPELAQVRSVLEALRADLEPHLFKEEQMLFPMIRHLEEATTSPQFHCATLANPIAMMCMEHDRVGVLLTELRDDARGYEPPEDACTSYKVLYGRLARLEADTHLHVHKENNVLFPAVIKLENSLAESSR